MATPVAKLMQGGPVPIDRFDLSLGPRHLYEIVDRAVICAIATDAEVGARRLNQGIYPPMNEPFGKWCRRARKLQWQIFALVGVEDGESLQKRNRVGLVPVPLGAPAFLIRHEAVGIDDGRVHPCGHDRRGRAPAET